MHIGATESFKNYTHPAPTQPADVLTKTLIKPSLTKPHVLANKIQSLFVLHLGCLYIILLQYITSGARVGFSEVDLPQSFLALRELSFLFVFFPSLSYCCGLLGTSGACFEILVLE